MAKMVQDLSQDFIYDDEVKDNENNKKKKLTPKQRNYVIGLSILGVALICISVIYALAANIWLADYKTVGYLTFAYPTQTEEQKENGIKTEAQVVSIDLNSNYPSTFRIPSKINGHPITSIADNAFQGADRLKKIIMTDNIKSVGDNAFAGCENLKEFKWSKNLNHIGTDAFLNTAYEASWDENGFEIINNILLNVGTNYFPNNTVLVNNESSLANVPEEYKTSSYSIKYFDDFSSGVSSWMNGLFQDNSKIVYLETPSYLDYIPIDAFSGCSNLEVVSLGEHVTYLYSGSFKNCSSLTKINLDNVTYIGEEALMNSDINFTLDLTDVTYIGDSAFEGCEFLTDVTYSSTLTNVSNSLFKNCSSLQNITFPNVDLIDSFGVSAFENTAFTSFVIPRRVNSLNDRLFANCSSLTSITLYNNTANTTYSIVDEGEDGEENVTVISEGIARINAYVFYNCPLFKSIKLYDTNGNIESWCTDDETIYLPVTLTSTNNSNGNDSGYSFAKTSSKSVIFNNKLITIGNSFFEGNKDLTSVTFARGEIVKDDNDKVIDPGYSIISIGDSAFKGTTSLTSITIPSTVNILGTYAFEGSGISSIEFENPIGEYKTITSLQGGTFNNCLNLSSVTLSNSISMIAKNTFSNCPNLTSLYIPSSIKTLNQNAFTKCGNETNKLDIFLHKTLSEYLSNSYFYKNSQKEALWCDDSCELYLYSEEMPTEASTACKGFFHFDDLGEIVIWPDII